MSNEEKEIRTNRIVLEDKQGRPRIVLSGDDRSGPTVAIFDENDIPRIELFMDDKGKPNIVLIDEHSDSRGLVILDNDGLRLELIDEEQRCRSALVAGWKGPKLIMYEQSEGRIFSQTLCEEVEENKQV